MANWYDNINQESPTAPNTTDQPTLDNGNKMVMPRVQLGNSDLMFDFKGAGIGLIAGFALALLMKKNKILFSSIGAAAGGLGSTILRPKEGIKKAKV